eukprot:CAMPEP_0118949466 /NCGR_PEP_ID=MMETSP1169-20130426/49683_1 /TAXON_ID=36882 /ORGANISM="Pyramimonas obovata, Strain CCMP722" /LENGTH=184 /DNA_ID=CAMNT_0006896111 /DNA_START=95 /DNA_END=646 /DNA_ORIENTATION=-
MGAMFGKVAVEVPQYEVLLKKPLYEIRKYPPFVIVSTSTEDMVEGNNSFGRLARYIGVFGSPENSKKEAISMTAPVLTGLESTLTGAGRQGSPGSMKMSFVLPSVYKDVRHAPDPTSSDVSVANAHWGTVACLTFSGWASAADCDAKEAELKKILQGEGHKVTGSSMLARYNPPWTLGPLRTNE